MKTMTNKELKNYCNNFLKETMDKRMNLDMTIHSLDYKHHFNICSDILYHFDKVEQYKREIREELKKGDYMNVDKFDYINNQLFIYNNGLKRLKKELKKIIK